MRLQGKIIVLGVFIVFFVQFSIHSQSFHTEIKALSKGADLILTGKVVKQESEWTRNKSGIITKTTIQVDEYLKGNGNTNSIVINHPGGEVDGVGELYTHMPRFTDNEEVLLFLKKDKNSPDYKVYSGEDGKIPLIRNTTGEKVTTSNISLRVLKTQIKSYTN